VYSIGIIRNHTSFQGLLMAINISCPNAGCGQVVAVKEEHAGLTVVCPKCGGNVVVPTLAAPAGVAPESGPPPIGSPPPAGIPSAGFVGNLERLGGAQKILLLAGLGCLGLMVISTLLPWLSASIGFGPLGSASVSTIGLRTNEGVFQLLVGLGALGFAIGAIASNQEKLYDISIWTAAGCTALTALWRLINVADWGGFSAFGVYLALLATLGAAGTLGAIGFQKLMKK
jgi:hypothetical protein